jgi:hypothetical protein
VTTKVELELEVVTGAALEEVDKLLEVVEFMTVLDEEVEEVEEMEEVVMVELELGEAVGVTQ